MSKITPLRGEITVPGDKSISHRSIMFGSIAKGTTEISGFLNSADCRSTISCFKKMGIEITLNNDKVSVIGNGLYGLSKPKDVLDVGNSGTTMRLISGILSGQSFSCILDGDESIRKRPMKRIIDPLSAMGASISSNNGLCPLTIKGTTLSGIDYTLPVASAQVKSAVLLAGLYATGTTSVLERHVSRNHTELMLKAFGADINTDKEICEGTEYTVSKIKKADELYGQKIEVPGDISSAAYFLALGLIHPNSDILIKNVNINETRAGIIDVIKKMGGDISLLNKKTLGAEPVCDINVKSSSLSGIEISGDIIPRLIDEIPIICIMAAFAKGKTIIKDAGDLKNKESNRIETVSMGLKAIGCDVTPTEDGMIIEGGCSLNPATIITKKDHRIAMSFAILSTIIPGIKLDYPGCVNISYENFYEDLAHITGEVPCL